MYLSHVTAANLIATVILYSSLASVFAIQTPSPSPTPQPTKVFRVSSGVEAGLLRHKVDPVYPPEAKKKHIKGDVMLRVIIDKAGNVASASVVQGDPMLVDAAAEAVKQWKYKPYLLNDAPIEVETMVTVHFGK